MSARLPVFQATLSPTQDQGSTAERARVERVGQAPPHCLDCPATRNQCFSGLIGESSACCQFESLAIEAREAIPLRWFGRFAFGVVRRGYLIRQRADTHGRVTAVDAVGPGSSFPIEADTMDVAKASTSGGYAVTRTLVCVAPEVAISTTLLKGGSDAVDLHTAQREALYRMERIADARGRSTVASRVAALTCALADTLVRHAPSHTRVPAGFMLRDFAALTSVRHESVCRVLRDLGQAGLVTQDDDGLHILDRKGLESV
jgi:Crp-like helix-turn-helix domain